MRITRVLLETASLGEAADFYSDVLGLAVDRTDEMVSVRVGNGLLEFTRGEQDPAGVHHLAFLVAAEAFDAAVAWLRARTPILSLDGQEEFEGPGAWNSRSVSFDGPDGSILELIARRNLPSPPAATGGFSAEGILGISEVGIAVADLHRAVRQLADPTEGDAILPFGSTSEEFAPTGDEHGLLILVAPGRTWFPTPDRTAAERTTTVYAVGGMPRKVALGRYAELVIEA